MLLKKRFLKSEQSIDGGKLIKKETIEYIITLS